MAREDEKLRLFVIFTRLCLMFTRLFFSLTRLIFFFTLPFFHSIRMICGLTRLFLQAFWACAAVGQPGRTLRPAGETFGGTQPVSAPVTRGFQPGVAPVTRGFIH